MNNWCDYNNTNSLRTRIAQSTASVSNDYFANTKISVIQCLGYISHGTHCMRLSAVWQLNSVLNAWTQRIECLCIETAYAVWSHRRNENVCSECTHNVCTPTEWMKIWSGFCFQNIFLNGISNLNVHKMQIVFPGFYFRFLEIFHWMRHLHCTKFLSDHLMWMNAREWS